MQGVFAFNAVSGCFGPSGVWMWGDGATRLIPAEDGCVPAPKRVDGVERPRLVRISGTHVLVLCEPKAQAEEASSKAQGEASNAQGEASNAQGEASNAQSEAGNAQAEGNKAEKEPGKGDEEGSAKREREEQAGAGPDESEAKKPEIGA